MMLIISLLPTLAASLSLSSAPPSDYYSSIDSSLRGAALAKQLTDLISIHTVVTYASLWEAFKRADEGAAHGTSCSSSLMSDIYSAKCWQPGTEQCGNYKKEGDCYNREHSWPKAWWGGATIASYTDLHHLFPSDGYDNNRRSNYALGNIDNSTNPSYNTTSGSMLGHCIPSSGPASRAIPGAGDTPPSSSPCWQPSDQLKGELARVYLYMSVCYAEIFTCCDGDAVNGATLKPWMLATVLDWHAQYPPTASENARHEIVFQIQANRNPFIDYPEWADYVFLP
jgi:endonuclease I